MYEREKSEMNAALSQAFPNQLFKVYAVASEGCSSASVEWKGGPERTEVKAIMGPWERRFGPISLYREDPQLLQTYAHLQPKSDNPRESSHDLGVLNVQRHLKHVFPNTVFEISDSLGPMTNHTSVTVKWDTTIEGSPTLQDCKAALEIFKSVWPRPSAQVNLDFRRMFGSFNYVELESRPTPAPVVDPEPVVIVSPPPRRRWWQRG